MLLFFNIIITRVFLLQPNDVDQSHDHPACQTGGLASQRAKLRMEMVKRPTQGEGGIQADLQR